jgi:hypothetical protein
MYFMVQIANAAIQLAAAIADFIDNLLNNNRSDSSESVHASLEQYAK